MFRKRYWFGENALSVLINAANVSQYADWYKYTNVEGFNPVDIKVDLTDLIPRNINNIEIPCSAYAIEHGTTFTVNQLTDLNYDTCSSVTLSQRYGVTHPSYLNHTSLIITSNGETTFDPLEFYTLVNNQRVRADYFSGLTILTEVLPITTQVTNATPYTTNGNHTYVFEENTYPTSYSFTVNVQPKLIYKYYPTITSNGTYIITPNNPPLPTTFDGMSQVTVPVNVRPNLWNFNGYFTFDTEFVGNLNLYIQQFGYDLTNFDGIEKTQRIKIRGTPSVEWITVEPYTSASSMTVFASDLLTRPLDLLVFISLAKLEFENFFIHL
eukprot:jgi/Orpsp1_1/1177036/evm.model.c7180000059942.1